MKAPTAYALTVGYTIGTGIGTITAFYSLRHHLKDAVRSYSFATAKELLRIAWPLALAGVLGTLMINTDTIMLGWWRTSTEIGYYSAALRPVSVLYGTLGIIPPAMFPAIAPLVLADKEKFRAVVTKTLRMVGLIGFPIIIGGIVLAQQFMILLYGHEYIPGTPSFQILLASLITNLTTITLTYVFLAHHKQKSLMWFSLAGLVGNTIFDFFFIPRYGGPGSAVATLLNQIIVTGLMWQLANKLMGKIHFIDLFKKTFLASIAMGVITFLLILIHISTFLTVPISAVAYFAFLYVIKESSIDEFKILLGQLRQK